MNHPLEAHHVTGVTVLMNPNETELKPKRLRTKVCYFFASIIRIPNTNLLL